MKRGTRGRTAGEGPGQPGTTGKPPLALAYFNPIFLCICFGYKNAFLFLWRSCLWHSDTTPYYTTPVGAAIRIAPIITEVAERVFNTLLSLWKPLWRICRSTKVGDAIRRKILTIYFEKRISEKPRNGNTLTGCLEKGKVFEKEVFGWK